MAAGALLSAGAAGGASAGVGCLDAGIVPRMRMRALGSAFTVVSTYNCCCHALTSQGLSARLIVGKIIWIRTVQVSN